MSLITNFDININFWNIAPQYKVIEPFKALYKRDRTVGKLYSSRVMWAVSFLTHPDSPVVRLPEDDKKLLICSDYLEDDKFDWSKHKDLINKFIELELTKAERSSKLINYKIEERESLIKDTPYTMSNAGDLDKLIMNTEKIYELRKKLEEDAKRKDEDGIVKGGSEESLSEKNLI